MKLGDFITTIDGSSDSIAIFDALCDMVRESAKEVGSEEFIPPDKIDTLVTRVDIEGVLEKAGASPPDQLARFVVQKARKVFLILLEIGELNALSQLQDCGFDDSSLPMKKRKAGNNNQKSGWEVGSLNATTHNFDNHRHWPVFGTWRLNKIHAFETAQWKFLTAVFQEGKFRYTLPQKIPLPILPSGNEDITPRTGHFSDVYKLRLYTPESSAEAENKYPQIALKIFRVHLKDYFHREARNLQMIQAINHQHLIKPVAAFERGESRCFIFPWANGGNLRDLWKQSDNKLSEPPASDSSLVRWALEQMCGLADCLTTLYNNNCRHGDLKPENILRFTDCSGRGRLVIADFGLAKFHLWETMRRNGNSSIMDRTLRYEPPEMGEYMEQQPRSRGDDVWSMGCIFLEFTIWLLCGWDHLEQFNQTNKEQKFWEDRDGKRQVHHRVQDEFAEVLGHSKASGALNDLLVLIQDRLLVVKDSSSDNGRATAPELKEQIDGIYKRFLGEDSYLMAPKIPRGPQMGNTLTVRGKPPLPRISKGTSTLNNDGGLKVVVRAPTGDFDSNDESANHVINPQETQTTILKDDWESISDNKFSNELFKRIDWPTLRPSPSSPRLCQVCARTNFSSERFEWTYNLQQLQNTSSECDFCKICYQGLLGVGIGHASGTLVRVGSTLRAGQNGPPLISIYTEPNFVSTSPDLAQVGFPMLPDIASSEQYELLQEWLRVCDEDHSCWPWKSIDPLPEMPTRVIGVGLDSEPVLRLVETRKVTRAKYVALSHCWGNITENERFCAKTNNIDQIMKHINFNHLPKTFQDAVSVTRKLKVQYLWIDSICIIQDDKKDWETESEKMENVFSSAYCTLAASSARSSMDGFLGHAREPRQCIIIESSGPGPLYLCKTIDNFHRDVEEGVLNTRGWVFQERALSRRIIHFTSNQIYWECGQGVHCETLAKLRNSVAGFMGDSDFPKSALPYFKGGRIVLWQSLYHMYSKLAFTEKTDRSVALIGLEKRLGREFQTKAEFGIMEEYLERSLLWQRNRNGRMLTRIRYPPGRYVPSWSWMAYIGEIEYLDVPLKKTHWFKEDMKNPFDSGSIRVTQAQEEEVDLKAAAKNLNMTRLELLTRVVFDDESEMGSQDGLKCVVIGREKVENEARAERTHYVLVIKPRSGDSNGLYDRAGVGCLLARHISDDPLVWVTIR